MEFPNKIKKGGKKLLEERKKREEEREKAKLIKKEYPDGYKKWFEKPLNFPLFNLDHFIVNEEKEIALLDKHVKSEKWEKEQKEFSSLCYESSEKYLPKYGRYSYNIPFTKYDVNGKEIKGTYEVWQLFYSSMCLRALDYTNCPYYKTNAVCLFYPYCTWLYHRSLYNIPHHVGFWCHLHRKNNAVGWLRMLLGSDNPDGYFLHSSVKSYA